MWSTLGVHRKQKKIQHNGRIVKKGEYVKERGLIGGPSHVFILTGNHEQTMNKGLRYYERKEAGFN
jgi:hypothetical protein